MLNFQRKEKEIDSLKAALHKARETRTHAQATEPEDSASRNEEIRATFEKEYKVTASLSASFAILLHLSLASGSFLKKTFAVHIKQVLACCSFLKRPTSAHLAPMLAEVLCELCSSL